MVGLSILLLLALAGLLAPWIAPHSPTAITASRVLKGPDWSHPLGSDALGRDVLSRLLFAFRTSLAIARARSPSRSSAARCSGCSRATTAAPSTPC